MQARIGYGVIFVLFVVLAWFLRDYGEQILGKITIWNEQCPDEKCFGKQGVLRISLSLFIFFFGMSLAMIGHKNHDENNFRTRLQDGFWPVKVLVLVILIILAYLIPNKALVWYGYAAMIGAIFFIFVQILLLVDFAYDWNDKWVAKERYKSVLASSIVIYIASAVGIILMFVWFGNSSSCGLNIFLIIFCALLSIIATALSLSNEIERGSLLTSAVVSGFCTYLIFSSLLISPAQCNPFPPVSNTRTWLLVVGIIIAIGSLCRNTISSASQRGVFRMSHNESEDSSLLGHEGECYNFSYFHLVFACGAMYMAMLFTGWNLSSTTIVGQFDIGPMSMWMKIVSSWIAALMYIWSMVGPKLLPNREWA